MVSRFMEKLLSEALQQLYKSVQAIQQKFHEKGIVSSIINEVIRENFRPFYFSYEEILHTKKSIKSKQATFTQIFLYA